MVQKTEESCSIDELITCFLSRQIEDGDEVGAGAGSAIARTAMQLAAMTRCPNLVVRLGETRTNLLNVGLVEAFKTTNDGRAARWGEYKYTDDEVMLQVRKANRSIFTMGGLQVDKYGNCNLIGIGDDPKRLKIRGPGGIGAPEMAAHVKFINIQVGRHDKRTFVEKCDYISQVGWYKGGDSRKKLGLPGGGPRYVITPLCIMDFEEDTKRMRLKSVHPGVTVEQVVENTGFELIVPETVPQTEPPTKEELEFLRTRIDTEGMLRR